MRVCWNNLFDDATITSYSENPNYPLANLKLTQLSNYFKTIGYANEWIKIDCGSAVAASRFAILGHNLSASAVITLQANTTDSWTTPAWSETVTRQSYHIIHRFTEASYRYWRVLITDTAVVQIARLYLGTFLQLPGMAIDQELNMESTDDTVFSESGQAYPVTGYTFRSGVINFPFLTNDQRLSMVEMYEAVRNSIPVLLCIWDGLESMEEPVYCILNQSIMKFKRTKSTIKPWSGSITVKEVF